MRISRVSTTSFLSENSMSSASATNLSPAAVLDGASSCQFSGPKNILRNGFGVEVCLSPVRAAPTIPTSSSISCRASEEDGIVGSIHDTAVQDTTIVSNLSDEIQKVEARLAAIQEEESKLMPRRAVSKFSVCDRGRLDPVLDPQLTNRAMRRSSSTRHVDPLSDTDVLSAEIAPSFCGNSRRASTADIGPLSVRGGEDQAHRSRAPSMRCKESENLVSKEVGRDSLVSTSTSAEHLCRTTPGRVNTQMEPRSLVFSLADFLCPLRTVDIEITKGVYETLEIFAGEDMADVAKRFITKHNLDAERAFKPLHAFLLSLGVNKASESPAHPVSRARVPLSGEKKKNITTSTATGSKSNAVRSFRGKSEGCDMTLGCPDVNYVPRHSARGFKNEKNQSAVIPCNDCVVSKKVLDTAQRKERSNSLNTSNKTFLHDQKQAHLLKPSVNDSRSLSVPKCQGKTQTLKAAPPVLANKTTSPEVVTLAGEGTRPRRTCSSGPMKTQLLRRCSSTKSSRCRSAEPCETISNPRTGRSGFQKEEPMPTFRPTLAPHSRQLVAQDAERQKVPTHVRLHARTPKMLETSREGDAKCTRKPRTFSRKREDLSQEPAGQRLYEQALDQRRRLQEKQWEEQRRKEEENRRLMTKPKINKQRGRSAHDKFSQESASNGVRTRSGVRSQRNVNAVKPSEERELEACTFAPSINPASVRMFSMVVCGQTSEDEHADEGDLQKGLTEQVSSGRDQTRSRRILRDKPSVEDRLLLLEQQRKKRLEEERLFRGTIDATTGRPFFQPFLGR